VDSVVFAPGSTPVPAPTVLLLATFFLLLLPECPAMTATIVKLIAVTSAIAPTSRRFSVAQPTHPLSDTAVSVP
jgi:hypothetical protein